jgi:hypothetical protein
MAPRKPRRRSENPTPAELEAARESFEDFRRETVDPELLADAIADLPPEVREAQEQARRDALRGGLAAAGGLLPAVGSHAWALGQLRNQPHVDTGPPRFGSIYQSDNYRTYRDWERAKSSPDSPQSSDQYMGGTHVASVEEVKAGIGVANEKMGAIQRINAQLDQELHEAQDAYGTALQGTGHESATNVMEWVAECLSRCEDIATMVGAAVEAAQTYAAGL